MADVTTGLLVKTTATEFVNAKVMDTGGTNLLAVSAAGAGASNITQVGGSAITLGAKTSANSFPVVLASDQAVLPVGSATAAAADGAANPTTSILQDFVSGFNGTTWDRLSTTDRFDGNGALTQKGVLMVGVGPGWARRLTGAALGTANNSAVTFNVNGAGTAAIEINTATTGTFVIEATVDGTTWTPPITYDVGGAAYVTNSSLTPTVGKTYIVSVNGFQQVRIRTNATLGTTVANTWTLSLGDAIPYPSTAAANASTNITQWNGVTVTAAAALADAMAMPTAPLVGAALMVANGTPTLDRVRAANGDAMSAAGLIASGLMGWNGATWDRIKATATGILQTDLRDVGGSAIALGQAAMAASLPVVIASNQTNVPTNTVQYGGTNVVTGGTAGSVGVGGLAASAASIVGNPVLIGATFTTAQPTVTTGQVVNLQSDSRGALLIMTGVNTPSFNVSQYGGTAVVSAGVAGLFAVGGAAASGATLSGNPVRAGGAFNTTQPTVTNGQGVDLQATARGALIIATGVDIPAVNITQVLSAAPSATNPLPVRLADGAAFYNAASSAPTSPQFGTLTSASLGAGSNVDLTTAAITNGKTGRLAGIDFSSTVPCKLIVSTVLTSTPTTRVILFVEPYVALSWRPPFSTYITQVGNGSTNFFRVNVTNKDASSAADVYATIFWDEV